jgi:hypothetical protein
MTKYYKQSLAIFRPKIDPQLTPLLRQALPIDELDKVVEEELLLLVLSSAS